MLNGFYHYRHTSGMQRTSSHAHTKHVTRARDPPQPFHPLFSRKAKSVTSHVSIPRPPPVSLSPLPLALVHVEYLLNIPLGECVALPHLGVALRWFHFC